LLLATMALAPVLQWGRTPSPAQKVVLGFAAALGLVAATVGLACGLRSPIALTVTATASLAVAALVGSLVVDARRKAESDPERRVIRAIQGNRRQYSGFLIHIGFVCLAIGVTGSSLGASRIEVILSEGETIDWAGRTVNYESLVQRELPDRLVAEAVLRVSPPSGPSYTLRPARHLHVLQNEWTSEVAIHSTWSGDFYTILNSGEGEGRVSLTLVSNPLMRFLWFGAGVMVIGVIASLWPARKRTAIAPEPHWRTIAFRRKQGQLVESK